ncbi:protein Bouncer-like [Melanotaenia boesemani]|uniref:protein Bouncer-like n=1 Tax=Melanotaenia boesemani TaxID=1250792 RepID=UPI001C042147|nr:protein Bouncer-like [Melanotaenia boesemani]
MASQRETSVDIHLSGPRWFRLTSILLVSALVLPTLSLQSLLCYFCPLQDKSVSCSNSTSQCLPNQHCSSSRGYYGSVHMLSAQGCVDADLCDSHEIISFRGVEYNVSRACCCKDKCNTAPKPDSIWKKLLGMIKAKMDNTTNIVVEEASDSCANYTLTAAFPTIKT